MEVFLTPIKNSYRDIKYFWKQMIGASSIKAKGKYLILAYFNLMFLFIYTVNTLYFIYILVIGIFIHPLAFLVLLFSVPFIFITIFFRKKVDNDSKYQQYKMG
ncbi:hypothetical protein HM131_17060 [Halobacillus mangrovi]|uniref:Uncharacterized protein n=1 Tax=Halobacillus mangrovi TaxID=402384 RepID=A0A1W5ZYU1_9BACI|nr:hypothetical protein HM131_17060 [Halobacillus mangrovi]